MKDAISRARAELKKYYNALATYSDLVEDSGDRYVLSKELNALLNPDCYSVDQIAIAVDKIQNMTGVVFEVEELNQ